MLGAIEQQHLQELYDAAGVPRDELPYTEALTRVCKDFQDRTFKNANEAQVYGAIVKYVRSGRRAKPKSGDPDVAPDRAEHARLLRAQRAQGPKPQPYTREFEYARGAFARAGGPDLSPHEYWCVLQLASRRSAAPRSAVPVQPVH